MREGTPVRQKYACFDLFAGAGGFSLGVEAAGFHSVGAIEVDEMAGASYKANFGETPASYLGPQHGNIRKIAPQEIGKQLSAAGITEIDLLLAGPPCQGFSRVGRGKLDSMAAQAGSFADDERNTLYGKAIAVLLELRPRVFVLENVPGMLHLRGRNVAEAVCDAIGASGYHVRCALLNSAWYGVPQTRERLFIIGTRADLGIYPRFPAKRFKVAQQSCIHLTPPRWSNTDYFVPESELPEADFLAPAITVSEAFADLPPFTAHLDALRSGARYRARREQFKPTPYQSEASTWFSKQMRSWKSLAEADLLTDHFCRWTPRDYETFRRMRPGDLYPQAVEIATIRYQEALAIYLARGGNRPQEADYVPPYRVDNFPHKWRKLVPNEPSWTVTAHLSKDTYSHIHFDSSQARAVTIREAARLQSFPDRFEFRGNMGDALRQIGNAVPPLLAREIGTALWSLLQEMDSTQQPEELAFQAVG